MINPGKILYKAYFEPLARIRKTLRLGFWNTFQLEKGRKAMMLASEDLNETVYHGAPTYEVYFLTGQKYWYQTAFCLYSFQKQSGVNICATIIDDGSFDDALEQKVTNQFPSSKVIRKETIHELLELYLPESRYPTLRSRRLEYPHLRKLTDVHILPGSDWKLVFDSDMLFFCKPMQVLEWLENPCTMLFMEDVQESYGYPISLLQQLAGTNNFPPKLNVGITGMASSLINWDELEFWARKTIETHGTSYLQEQGLTAVIAAKNGFELLPENSYKVMPEITDTVIKETLHHYVADSKYDYFLKGWKSAL